MRAVILIPAPGDPLGLPADGKCGARPPVVYRARWASRPGQWSEWRSAAVPYDAAVQESALVLAWDGTPVPDGIFRAWFHADDVPGDVLSDMLYAERLDEVVELARSLRRNCAPLGDVVTLGAPA